MKNWCLVGAVSLLAGCGLFKVNVNGEVKTFGGSGSSSGEEEPTRDAKSSSSSGGSKQAKGGGGSAEAAKSDKEKLKTLRMDTKELRRELDKLVVDDPGPIPAAKLAQLEARKKDFADAGLEPEVHYLAHLRTYYDLENAWRTDAAKSPDQLASVLGGKVAASGELTGKDKPQTFKFKAEAGKCYTVLLRMKNAGGEEDKMTSFKLDAGKANSSLQRFRVDQRRSRGAGVQRSLSKSYTQGACALKDTEIAATAELKYAGSQNALRYVVVETTREKFPQYLALDLEAELNDSCDAENWTSLWTNPLPGAVLYGAEAPYMPYDVGTAEDMWMTAWSAGHGEVRVKREDLSSVPPKQFKFNNKVNFRGCPKELKYARSADGIKVASCYDRLQKKYDPQWDAAEKARDNAPGLLAQIAAERRIKQLNNQYDDEVQRTCKKLDAEVGKKFEDAYSKLVDFYTATPPKAPFDRGKELKLTYEGVVQIMCVGTHTCSL